jgi:acyl-CoA thioester hydrolase
MEPEAPNRNPSDAFSFFHALRVPWVHVDQYGIVYHPHYFVYFHLAMVEYLRHLGFSVRHGLDQLNIDLFSINMSANFRGPAYYDDELRIGIRVAYFGTTSVQFVGVVFREDDLLVEGSITYVTLAKGTRTPVALPQQFVDLVSRFETTPPLRKQ